jgi:hypothetical protein
MLNNLSGEIKDEKIVIFDDKLEWVSLKKS